MWPSQLLFTIPACRRLRILVARAMLLVGFEFTLRLSCKSFSHKATEGHGFPRTGLKLPCELPSQLVLYLKLVDYLQRYRSMLFPVEPRLNLGSCLWKTIRQSVMVGPSVAQDSRALFWPTEPLRRQGPCYLLYSIAVTMPRKTPFKELDEAAAAWKQLSRMYYSPISHSAITETVVLTIWLRRRVKSSRLVLGSRERSWCTAKYKLIFLF